MSMNIRTKEKCPKCKGKFIDNSHSLICPQCLTAPKRYFVDFYWHGKQWKIYSTKNGLILSSYNLAITTAKEIRMDVENNCFYPSNYRSKNYKHIRSVKKLLERSESESPKDNHWIIKRWKTLNAKERQAIIFTLFKGRCLYCNRKVRIPLVREKKIVLDRCVLDHKIPFSHGGPDSFDNIVLSCEECNRKKGERNFEEFIESKT